MAGRKRRTLSPAGRDRRQPADIDAELAHHVEALVDELMAAGLTEPEARREAVRRFGDERRVRVALSRERRWRDLARAVDQIRQDTRYGLRQLARRPAFGIVAVVILALGIGATTAIFSLIDAALLRRPSVSDPSRVIAVYTTCRAGAPRCSSSYPDYLDYRHGADAVADLAATALLQVSLGEEGRGARLVRTRLVTGNFFTVLGLEAEIGRTLQPSDDEDGAAVAVLSHSLWRERFGSDPSVVGRVIRLNGAAYDVVGVAPRSYRGLALGEESDLWVPMQASDPMRARMLGAADPWERRGSRWMDRLVGRLATGATLEQARAQLLALSDGLREDDPSARGPRSVTVDPLGRYLTPGGSEESLPQFLLMLLAVVGGTLLITCANLANLLLARASSRSEEIGIRVSLGAGRLRLVRQLLVESGLLCLTGGLGGLAVATGVVRLLSAFELPGGVSVATLDPTLNARVLGVASALSLVTAVLCGIVPALHATRAVGRGGIGRRSGGPGAARLRGGLVAAQLALCVVLLIGSGLFVRTLQNALRTDFGFRTDELALARFDLGSVGYTADEALAYVARLDASMRAHPGVEASAFGSVLPVAGGSWIGTFAEVEGYEAAPEEEIRVELVVVSDGYFETLEIEIEEGRGFDGGDRDGTRAVVVVSREMAERYWPDRTAVGGRVVLGAERLEVVGVAADARWNGLDSPGGVFLFLPASQRANALANAPTTVFMRTDGDAALVAPDLRAEAAALDPDVPLEVVTTMESLLGVLLMPQRLGALLLSAFGLLALLLSAVGIGAVVAYTVTEQRRAIGVRLALGAGRDRVLWLVIRTMAGPVFAGLGVGIAAAALLDGTLERFLYGVSPGDPITYSVIAVCLTIVALLAALGPARKAMRVDPIQALRAD